MRRPTPGLLVLIFAFVGALLPVAPLGPISAVGTVAAATSPKVAVIVGPAGGNTAGYKSDADAIAAAARRYTANVVQVYTPNATWDAARAALQGASIVVYMGHGNGFPSPYSTSLRPSSQDGLGLNPVAGVDDSTTQYYGESYLASEIRLAPNAVVLLDHLCYASGNSEPGRADPSLAVAQLRADNFAAGFLAAGARAVIASAYYGGSQYIDALFTTDLTIDQIWQAGPGSNANVIAYQSSRTPGMTAELNPDASTGKYWRSLVGQLDLRASQVVGAAGSVGSLPGVGNSVPGGNAGSAGPAPVQPSSLSVPGTATVATAGAPLFASPSLSPDPTNGQPLAYLPAGMSVRLDGVAGAGPDGSQVYAVSVPTAALAGYMAGSFLSATTGGVGGVVRLLSIDDGGGTFSPNGDGRSDVFTLRAQLSAPASWQVAISSPAGNVLAATTGNGSTVGASWSGTSNGVRVPDGRYRYSIRATDGTGAMVLAKTGWVTVDTVPPALAVSSPGAAGVTTIAPNGDGVADRLTVAYSVGEATTIDVTVLGASGAPVRTMSVSARAGKGTFTWDGAGDAGRIVPDGVYTLVAAPRDKAGNVGTPWTKRVAVYAALAAVRTSVPVFFPQAPEGAPATTTFSFALGSPATVTWTVTDAAGHRLLTHLATQALAPGSYAFAWDGRDQSGVLVPRGTYYSVVRATNGQLTFAIRVAVVADAFAIRVSSAAPSRGQAVTVTVTAARPLTSPAMLTIVQPGTAPRTVAMPLTSAGYRLKVRLAAGTAAGTLQLIVSGTDVSGMSTSSSASYPLR